LCVINLAKVDERVVKKRRNPGVEILASAGSTFAAIFMGMLDRLAISIARSGRFSGAIRPRKAR